MSRKTIWTPDFFGWQYQLKHVDYERYRYWSPNLDIRINRFGPNDAFHILWIDIYDHNFSDSGYFLATLFQNAENHILDTISQAKTLKKVLRLK